MGPAVTRMQRCAPFLRRRAGRGCPTWGAAGALCPQQRQAACAPFPPPVTSKEGPPRQHPHTSAHMLTLLHPRAPHLRAQGCPVAQGGWGRAPPVLRIGRLAMACKHARTGAPPKATQQVPKGHSTWRSLQWQSLHWYALKVGNMIPKCRPWWRRHAAAEAGPGRTYTCPTPHI